MNKLISALSKLSRVSCNIGAGALLVLALMVSADVVIRALTGKPVMGIFELSGVLLVAITFLPLSFLLLIGRQMRIDIIFGFVGKSVRRILSLLDGLAGIAIFGIILWVSFQETLKAYTGRYLLRGLVEIPTWIPYSLIAVGMLLAILILFAQCTKHGTELQDESSLSDLHVD